MTELDEIAETVKAAVTEAMQSEARRALPTHQAMTGQWRLVVSLPDGEPVPFDADNEAEALERGEHFKHRPWQVEHRLVSAWTPVPLPAPLPPGYGADAGYEGRD